ncbi:MAG: hypothetical protein JST54_06225 [Deltaproteobacteria bacterium]|nr:hypothetical protein [Deltaproteobacteria bacterium]
MSTTPTTLGVRGSSQPQTSTVVFEVDDASGAPVADGVTITFTLNQTLDGADAATLESTSARTADGTGRGTAVVQTAAQPEVVNVVASVTGALATSPDITISQ